ncbi:Histidinol-phosphate aminotransferase (plasmid) [Cupriavidus taiwanensis]|uniref:Histidinol-phosphate aminotransferase n=1 Tax=Cupriavidus taiwanensis TaxID=164546 RepID=A0A375IPP1_9BURK|nr:histidinol-phosphate transaminase [Cupriavidus taiwanensis]SPK76030.1 Histidinol-phosphate aminotransferase [Cupriavidus taiwanensis]
MTQFWSSLARTLSPYVPGEQPADQGIIKLNTNENPFGPSPLVIEAVRVAADNALRLYPDPECRELRRVVASYHGISSNCVFAGNGSDEVLALCFQAFFDPGAPILIPDVSYSFYRVYVGLFGLSHREVPVTDRLTIRIDDYAVPCAGVVLANPNAPTGIALPLASIRRLLDIHPTKVVIVDEAYVDFGADSSLSLLHEYPNLVVVQTMSKSRSLAGLRVGFAFGQSHLIEALNRVKNSFNSYPIGRLAQAGAIASYKDQAHFQRTRAAIMESRNYLAAELEQLGFEVLPSAANFLFVRHPGLPAKTLVEALRRDRILVRHFDSKRVKEYLRISIGTAEQCAEVADCLRSFAPTGLDVP